jgi:hypothetical protein
MSDKPNDLKDNFGLAELVQNLLEACDPSLSDKEKTLDVRRRLRSLQIALMAGESGDVVDIDVERAVREALAKNKPATEEKADDAIPDTSRKAIETALSFDHPFSDDAMQAGLLIDEGNAFRVFSDGKIGMSVAAMQLMIDEIASRAQKRGQSGNAGQTQSQAE